MFIIFLWIINDINNDLKFKINHKNDLQFLQNLL